MDIAYEDEQLAVVEKPSGVLSQPGKTQDGSIATQARDFFKDASGPILVHRLDMDTSGLLLLAKNAQAHRILQQQFEKRQVYKEYEALLSQALTSLGGRIQLPLRLDVEDRPRQIMCLTHGKPSTTLWHHLPPNKEDANRVLFIPITGRSHQLRVHAAHSLGLNAPIVGDRLYGVAGQRLMLHARHLSFNHPVSNERISVESMCPF